jgi:L-threonylcarbamoyladenylate synthase
MNTSVILNPTPENIAKCAHALQQGELIGLPTETVYGLAADAGNRQAVARIYETKGRPADHPLIVHVSSIAAARPWLVTDGYFHEGSAHQRAFEILTSACWPGPLTLIVPRHLEQPDYACAGQLTVGLRCPSHNVAQQLLKQTEALGIAGIAAPSANRFGRISPTTARHVLDDLGDQCPLTLDGGACERGIESTIVDLSRSGWAILRPGSVSREKIELLLVGVLEELPSSIGLEPPKVSGSLAAHYAPLTPMELVATGSLDFRVTTIAESGGFVGVLALSPKPSSLNLRVNVHWISMPNEPGAYAHELYKALRGLDERGFERIVVERVPNIEPWIAVNDRLKRSATGAGG